jgi:hypothetical protein
MTGGPKKGDLDLLAPKHFCSGCILHFLSDIYRTIILAKAHHVHMLHPLTETEVA